MRKFIIYILKQCPILLRIFWKMARIGLKAWGIFVPVQPKTVLFASFGGRKFDDSPRAIYEEMCRRPEFADWKFIWAFVDPMQYEIPRGEKIRVDTIAFFKALLTSRVWVSNSGMDRGIGLKRNGTIKVETWHGTPLKKIGTDSHENAIGGTKKKTGPLDEKTIRCAQSEYDRDIFARLFHATKDSFLLCDLPRNDGLLRYTEESCRAIRQQLGIPEGKKVILYTPTYREYLINEDHDTYLAPPMDLKKWEEKLGNQYVFLVRAHYAVSRALNLVENEFVKDVSNYSLLNDLYAIADTMISDYSSTFFDYAILGRPMFCFAYDRQEYEEKRGLYLDLDHELPCRVDVNEDELLCDIQNIDMTKASEQARAFCKKYAPYAGNASKCVVDAILQREAE